MATTYSTRSQHCDTKSNSDFIDIFGPLEDRNPTTRIVRVPRLGYSATLSRPPPPMTPLLEQSMPTCQETSMFNSPFATMQSGPYGLGRQDESRRAQANNTTAYSTVPFPYATIADPMPLDAKTYIPNDVITVSPLQTTFDNGTSCGSYLNYDGDTQSAISSHSSFVLLNMPPEEHGSRKRSNGDSKDESESEPSISIEPFPTRRRKSSPSIESASARERYLEKNRRAATKCRSKQKKQQEELVENARDAERKNKILRAEVEILKEDMRELMQVVGEHSHCTDNRLRLYVQREADRLAAGIPRTAGAGRASGRSSDSPHARTTNQHGA